MLRIPFIDERFTLSYLYTSHINNCLTCVKFDVKEKIYIKESRRSLWTFFANHLICLYIRQEGTQWLTKNNKLNVWGLYIYYSFADNIALNKQAYQQNQFLAGNDKYDASNAVDRLKSDLTSNGGQCAISAAKKTATLWVNLTAIHSIHHITIYFMTNDLKWGKYSFLPVSSIIVL